jgi:hypothetical protein
VMDLNNDGAAGDIRTALRRLGLAMERLHG